MLLKKSLCGSKIRKVEELGKALTKQERNGMLRSQKVLTGRVFDSRIFEQPGIVELVKYVKH